jgi:endonuclease/exonuclease/phosphatase (EEP) superfamily protein YafD
LPSTDILRAALSAALIALCAACATVPPVQLAFAVGRDGMAAGHPLPCNGGATTANVGTAALPLPGPELRVLSWNLHKNGDPGWEADLARFAAASDLLLIQEAALTAGLRRVLQDAGYDWLLADSFLLDGHATGVLSAGRVRPASACVQRRFEPLLRLPKSAVKGVPSAAQTTATREGASIQAKRGRRRSLMSRTVRIWITSSIG